ncbi:hypothetical protein LY78DRAFT_446492 [Colletotrichum sublineola]|nr:hypothetical protein LY78DRAFT_446492 [Colletotrichum sublineola]
MHSNRYALFLALCFTILLVHSPGMYVNISEPCPLWDSQIQSMCFRRVPLEAPYGEVPADLLRGMGGRSHFAPKLLEWEIGSWASKGMAGPIARHTERGNSKTRKARKGL